MLKKMASIFLLDLNSIAEMNCLLVSDKALCQQVSLGNKFCNFLGLIKKHTIKLIPGYIHERNLGISMNLYFTREHKKMQLAGLLHCLLESEGNFKHVFKNIDIHYTWTIVLAICKTGVSDPLVTLQVTQYFCIQILQDVWNLGHFW